MIRFLCTCIVQNPQTPTPTHHEPPGVNVTISRTVDCHLAGAGMCPLSRFTGHRAVVTGRIVGNCISGGSGLAAAAASARESKHRKQDPLLLTIEASSWGLQLGEGFLLHYWTQKITIFVVVLMIQFSLYAARQGRPPSCTAPGFLGCENFC